MTSYKRGTVIMASGACI